MAHIKLRHIVGAMPHGQRLRKRNGRLLKPVKPSYKVELWYKQQLLAVVDHLRQIAREELLPDLRNMEPLYAKATDGLVRDRAAYSPVVSDMIEKMKRRVGGIEGVSKRLAEAATNRSLLETDERLKASIKASVKIDISGFLSRHGPIQVVTEAAVKANTALIKSIPDQYFEKLDDALSKNMERGMRYEDLAKEVERIGDVTESRAKLIARDQTSKLNGAMTQIRQLSLGIEEYDWQTAGDERVREEHADNDGRTFKWSDPPKTGHPGEDVNCRCVAIPRLNLDDPSFDLNEGEIRQLGGPSSSNTLAAMAAAAAISTMFAERTPRGRNNDQEND